MPKRMPIANPSIVTRWLNMNICLKNWQIRQTCVLESMQTKTGTEKSGFAIPQIKSLWLKPFGVYLSKLPEVLMYNQDYSNIPHEDIQVIHNCHVK
jgi:hypothetical protein